MISKTCLVAGIALVAAGLAGLFVEKISRDDGALLIAGAILLAVGCRGAK